MAREGERLHTKFHLNVFIVSASGSQNSEFWANFDIWGLLYQPLLPMRAKFGSLEHTNGIRLPAKFSLDRFILSPSGGENSHILPFLQHAAMFALQAL